MPTIKVTVTSGGSSVSGCGVALGVDGLTGGVTSTKYTDSNGIVTFDVQSGQGGDVYVRGSKKERWGSYGPTDIKIRL